MSNPVLGASYVLKGLSLITKPGVKRHVIIPLLINIVIFTGLVWLLADQFDRLIDWFLPTLPEWLAWLSYLLWLLFAIMAIIIVFFTFTFVANLIGSPFNPFLSAAVEKHLTGKTPESLKSFAAEAKDAILGELRKWGYFALWAIPLLILTFVPVVNLVAPILWFIFGSWMLSLEYMDYPLGNYGLAFPEIRQKVAERRMLSLGFGSAATVATMIPIMNFLVMPVCVAGATAMRIDHYSLKLPGPKGASSKG
jgi:CysZ protein